MNWRGWIWNAVCVWSEYKGGRGTSQEIKMAESSQHKLDRTRKPRVHITYDVEIGDAQEMKELPQVAPVACVQQRRGDGLLEGNPDRRLEARCARERAWPWWRLRAGSAGCG